MNEIADRIRELIDELALTNKSFAESISVAPAIISHVLSGRNNPSLHLIQQITNVYTNVNIDYLLNGKGSLFETIPLETNDRESIPVEQSSSDLPPGARLVSPPSGAPMPSKPIDIEEETHIQEEIPAKTSSKVQENSELTNVYTNVNKKIDRIVVFYKDRSFREYLPED